MGNVIDEAKSKFLSVKRLDGVSHSRGAILRGAFHGVRDSVEPLNEVTFCFLPNRYRNSPKLRVEEPSPLMLPVLAGLLNERADPFSIRFLSKTGLFPLLLFGHAGPTRPHLKNRFGNGEDIALTK